MKKSLFAVTALTLLAVTPSQAWIFDHGKEKEMQQEVVRQKQITEGWQLGSVGIITGGILLITGTILGSKGRKSHEAH